MERRFGVVLALGSKPSGAGANGCWAERLGQAVVQGAQLEAKPVHDSDNPGALLALLKIAP